MYKIAVLLIAIMLWAAPPLYAQNARYYEKITPGNNVTGFTSSKIEPMTGPLAGKKAIKALVYVKAAAVNYTVDGTEPTQSGGTDIGMYAAAGSTITVLGYHDIGTFRCIDATAGSASDLRVTYFFEE